MSIKFKLILIIIPLVILPLLFVSAITFSNYQNSIEAMRLSQMQDLARFKTERTEGYFSMLQADISMAQGYYNIRKHLPVLSEMPMNAKNKVKDEAREILDSQLFKMRNVLELTDIMLTSANGTIVYVCNPDHRAKDFSRSLSDISRESFEKGKNGIYVSDILINGAVDNTPEMLVVAPVFDFNKIFIGTIVFEVNMTVLYRLTQDTIGLGKTGEVLLGRRSGNDILYLLPLRHDLARAQARRIAVGSAIGVPIQKAVAGETGVGPSIDYRGKKVVAAWRPIPATGWGLVAKIDYDEAFASVQKLKRLVLLVLIVVLFVVVLIAIVISQSISHPIKKLTIGAEKIGRGDLDYRVGTNSKDEIGQLSRTFDKMTHDLKETTASRDDLNREIAERKRTEDALVRTGDDLKRSNKDLEQFAYVASHDLQEPLRAVAGFVGLLKKLYRHKLDGDAAEYIDLAVEGAERMLTLIHDLLTYSRVGTKGGAFVAMHMKDALDNALKNLQVAISETQTRITYDEMPEVTADTTQMTQLLQNLIANAIKFHGQKEPEIHIEAQRTGSEWVISVRDNGIGIEQQYYDRIFLIFQRLHTRSQFQGTGIGLAVCKKIVERHGGRIWVESKPGQGSTFFFTVPARV
jgi:signal transduction histidine kinase